MWKHLIKPFLPGKQPVLLCFKDASLKFALTWATWSQAQFYFSQ